MKEYGTKVNMESNKDFHDWLKKQDYYIVHEHWLYKNKLVSEETLNNKFNEYINLKQN